MYLANNSLICVYLKELPSNKSKLFGKMECKTKIVVPIHHNEILNRCAANSYNSIAPAGECVHYRTVVEYYITIYIYENKYI